MRSAFESSVPARKPKTQIGRVLTELTTHSAMTDPADNGSALEENGARSAEALAAISLRDAPPPTGASTEPAPVRETSTTAESTRASSEWDRLAALRRRLEVAAQPPTLGHEPQHTAAAVRKLIDDLRVRMEEAVKERSAIVSTLESTRAALARAEAELDRERKLRSHIEAQAAERENVAIQAVAEAEALAGERDLVLGELAERRRLQEEERTLLTEAESALNRHRAANEAAARELAEVRQLLDVRATEITELESRLQAEAAERAKVDARCRELEAELARMAVTAEALAAIKDMVSPRL